MRRPVAGRAVAGRALAGWVVAVVLAAGAVACSAGATPTRGGGPVAADSSAADSSDAAAGAGPGDPSTRRLVTAAALSPCPGPAANRAAAAGNSPRLPAITLACLGAGPPVALSALRGPAVVNLWASWCQPCRQEMPRLQALHAAAGSRLLVLGVVTDDDRRDALSAAAALGVHYPSILDTDGSLRRSYGFLGPPITLLIDRDGVVVQRIIGAVPALDVLRRTVSRRLGVAV